MDPGAQWVEAHRGDTPRLLRDRAMLLLRAVYGFGSAEVRRLTFDDIDWEQEIIRPPRAKQRKSATIRSSARSAMPSSRTSAALGRDARADTSSYDSGRRTSR